MRDTYHFLLLSYRNDVKEFGFDNFKETILTEDQFSNLEIFVLNEIKNIEKNKSFNTKSDLVKTKDLILSFRKYLNITKEIHNLLFQDDN